MSQLDGKSSEKPRVSLDPLVLCSRTHWGGGSGKWGLLPTVWMDERNQHHHHPSNTRTSRHQVRGQACLVLSGCSCLGQGSQTQWVWTSYDASGSMDSHTACLQLEFSEWGNVMCIFIRLSKCSFRGWHRGTLTRWGVGRDRPLASGRALPPCMRSPPPAPIPPVFKLVRAGDCIFKIQDLFERQWETERKPEWRHSALFQNINLPPWVRVGGRWEATEHYRRGGDVRRGNSSPLSELSLLISKMGGWVRWSLRPLPSLTLGFL